MAQMNLLNRITDVENQLVVAKQEGVGVSRYKLLYRVDKQGPTL